MGLHDGRTRECGVSPAGAEALACSYGRRLPIARYAGESARNSPVESRYCLRDTWYNSWRSNGSRKARRSFPRIIGGDWL